MLSLSKMIYQSLGAKTIVAYLVMFFNLVILFK